MKRNEKKRKIIAHRLDFESANLFFLKSFEKTELRFSKGVVGGGGEGRGALGANWQTE